ncbi:MAG: isoaspartyl peptidase/L-asparaginase, partial [Pseudoxanthomonas sp.]
MTNPTRPFTLVIHGGAGVIDRDRLSAADEQAIRADLDAALEAGGRILAAGGSALDAVEAAVVALEESSRFNAGKGSVYNADGRHELDASIMEGHGRRAGAVAGVETIRNPVSLARAVMERSPHVMMIGAGAERFADTLPQIERVANDWFDTDARRAQLDQEQARERSEAGDESLRGKYFGTVGAVALDTHGNLAAATSTGG